MCCSDHHIHTFNMYTYPSIPQQLPLIAYGIHRDNTPIIASPQEDSSVSIIPCAVYLQHKPLIAWTSDRPRMCHKYRLYIVNLHKMYRSSSHRTQWFRVRFGACLVRYSILYKIQVLRIGAFKISDNFRLHKHKRSVELSHRSIMSSRLYHLHHHHHDQHHHHDWDGSSTTASAAGFLNRHQGAAQRVPSSNVRLYRHENVMAIYNMCMFFEARNSKHTIQNTQILLNI